MARPCSRPARHKILRGIEKHKEHVPCQPTPAQRAALDELQDASVKVAERLKVDCPSYQTLTPTGRVEAMEKRLEATLTAVKTVHSLRSQNSITR